MGDSHTESKAYDVAMAFGYALLLGLNAYLIVNELTDGALSTSLAMKLAYLRQRISDKRAQHIATKREFGKVLWEATNIVEGNESD